MKCLPGGREIPSGTRLWFGHEQNARGAAPVYLYKGEGQLVDARKKGGIVVGPFMATDRRHALQIMAGKMYERARKLNASTVDSGLTAAPKG